MEECSLRDAELAYDERFERKMEVAKFLLKHLSDEKERRLAIKWLLRVNNVKSPLLEVKKDRDAFLSYLLKVLRDAVLTRCADLESDTVCDPDASLAFLESYLDGRRSKESQEDSSAENCFKSEEQLRFHSNWSENYRTYVGMKTIPRKGVLLYMAVSKKSGLEQWDIPPAYYRYAY